MSAGGAFQAVLAAALSTIDDVTGIYDGAPARALFPYVVIDAGQENDWSHKSGSGRELFVAVTLWDDRPARLHSLADAAEARVLAIGNLDDWQLVTLRLIRRRVIRDVAGPWAAVIDFRARLLAD